MKTVFRFFSKLSSAGLSTGKMVGSVAALGAAGIGAFSLLSSDSSNQNTAFNNPYNQQEIVYVAGAAGGNYQGGISGTDIGGESSFSMIGRSKAIEMQQREAERLAAAQKDGRDEYTAPDLKAYSFGSSEGLGGNNAVKEDFLAMGGMGAVDAASGKSGSIQAAIAQAQVSAQAQQAQALARAQGAAGASGAADASAGKGGLASRSAAQGGGALNGAWTLSGDSAGLPGSRGRGPEAGAAPTVRGEDVTLQARNISDGSRFGRDKDAAVGRARRGINGNNLQDMAKMSADIARNKNKKANEAGAIFFANGQYSGGIMVSDGASVGSSSGSSSSLDAGENSINHLGGALGEIENTEQDFKKERTALRKSFWGMAAMVVLKAMAVFLLLCSFLGAVFGVRLAKKWRKKIDQWIVEKADAYDQKWGDRSTTGQQLAFSAKNFLKPALWMGPTALMWVFTVMPWSLMKKYNTHGIEENDQDVQVNTTPGGSAGYSESGGDSLDLNRSGSGARGRH